MADVLIVTWLGGGATQPAIGLGRELASRGNSVRILAPARCVNRVQAAGCHHVPHPKIAEFDASLGRAMEDQLHFLESTFFDSWLADALAEQVARRRPDVVVVDYLLRAALSEAEALHVPRVALVHMRYHEDRGDGPGDDAPWSAPWLYRRANAHRVARGLPPLTRTAEPASIALARHADGAIVALPRAFDDWPDPPATVVHVGPIDEHPAPAAWRSPWPGDDSRPLVVVTLGTTYMHQEDVLRRVLGAFDGLAARLLVLTGSELGPSEVTVRGDARVEAYVPHAAVFPAASLVISHAGMGSLLEAFRAGVPSVCLPLGRDQHDNAAAAAARDAAIALPTSATSGQIRAAVTTALGSPTLRAGAVRMRQALAGCGGALRAATEIENLTRTTTAA